MSPYYEQDGISLFCADARDVLPTLDDSSINAVITDPPYFRVKGEWWDRQWDNRAHFLAWMGGLCDEWRRVLMANGSLYCFASPDLSWHVEGEIRQRFNVLNTVRWVKEAGWHNKTEKEALRSFLSPWESVIFAEQYGDEYDDAARALHKDVYAPIGRYIQQERERAGFTRNDVEVGLGFVSSSDPTRGTALCYRWEEGSSLPTKETYDRLRAVLNASGGEYLRRDYEELRRDYEELRRPFALSDRSEWSDVWNWRTVDPRYGKHPCEKPRAMMEHIITASTRPGDLVLDCFAGSGSTLDAARLTGRRAIGIEVSERHCETIIARLAQQVLPLTA